MNSTMGTGFRWGALWVVVGLLLCVFAEPSHAERRRRSKKTSDGYVTEKRKDGTTVKYKEKTSYDFEGFGVDGIYNKPSGSYISNIKDVKARTIIRIRKNFDSEVVDSARMLK